MKIKEIIIQKTIKIRYKVAFKLLRIITPKLYKNLKANTLNKNRNYILEINNKIKIRPSFSFMMDIFNKKLVIGVEIGVCRGENSEIILKCLNIEKLYLVDIWNTYEGVDHIWNNDNNYAFVLDKFKNNNKIKIIKNTSLEACELFENNSLDFIYIDANHQYSYVYQDIEYWYSKVKIGGIISGHDILLKSGNYPILNAVKDFCFVNHINFQFEPSDWYFIKEKELKK